MLCPETRTKRYYQIWYCKYYLKLTTTDPFYEVYGRRVESSQLVLLFRSEVIKNNLNPLWNTSCVLNTVDVGGLDMEFHIYVYDYDEDGTHGYI